MLDMTTELKLEPGPHLILDDGYRIQVDVCGGFNLFTPHGEPFAWAQTMDEADHKLELKRTGRL